MLHSDLRRSCNIPCCSYLVTALVAAVAAAAVVVGLVAVIAAPHCSSESRLEAVMLLARFLLLLFLLLLLIIRFSFIVFRLLSVNAPSPGLLPMQGNCSDSGAHSFSFKRLAAQLPFGDGRA